MKKSVPLFLALALYRLKRVAMANKCCCCLPKRIEKQGAFIMAKKLNLKDLNVGSFVTRVEGVVGGGDPFATKFAGCPTAEPWCHGSHIYNCNTGSDCDVDF